MKEWETGKPDQCKHANPPYIKSQHPTAGSGEEQEQVSLRL